MKSSGSLVGLMLTKMNVSKGYKGTFRSMSNLLDMRSDTVSKPCKAMREAIFHAKVGDDVFGEDPSVKKLEEVTAQLCGMEKALYFPSGTSHRIAQNGPLTFDISFGHHQG